MYQALYRKWRPQVFSDVVGQPHITTTLMNEVDRNIHSHAYLFTGSRGTGKTTCAKIFAKAVNCLNPQNGDPCNECEICKGIDNGSIMDVIEIDAASNNGVDNIRDLREEVNFTPVNTKYRVYIIDEVHMLSIGAFNALLKTLEEPPQHAKFVLATTEVHKIPATIMSRCQRFDFHRISSKDIASRLSFIATQEGLELAPDAAVLISRLADGALRDALSILDQCIVKGKNITLDIVNEVVGLAGSDYLFSLSKAVNEKDSAKALETIDYLHNHSCDMERLCNELINHFRNLMIVKTVENPQNIIVCTDEELHSLRQMAQFFDMDSVLHTIDILGNTLSNLRMGLNRRVEMEMAMIKLCSSQGTDNASLAQRIKNLENAISGKNFKAPNVSEIPAVVTPPVPKPMASQASAAQPKVEEMQKTQSTSSQATVPEVDVNSLPFDVYDSARENPLPFDADDSARENPSPFDVDDIREDTIKTVAEEARQESSVNPTPVQNVMPEEQNPTPIKDGEVDPQKWLAVIRQTINEDKGLIGAINNSTAYKKGEMIQIKSNNILFKKLMEQEYHINAVKKAVKIVFGQDFKVVVSDGEELRQKQEKKERQDPLEDLVNHAKNLDFNFKIEEL